MLGDLIADVVEKKTNKYALFFKWRDPNDVSIHGDSMRTPEFERLKHNHAVQSKL